MKCSFNHQTSTINKFIKSNSAINQRPKVKKITACFGCGFTDSSGMRQGDQHVTLPGECETPRKGERKRAGALDKQKHSFSVTPFWEMWGSFLLKIKTDGLTEEKMKKAKEGLFCVFYSLAGLRRCQRGRNPVSEWFNHVWGQQTFGLALMHADHLNPWHPPPLMHTNTHLTLSLLSPLTPALTSQPATLRHSVWLFLLRLLMCQKEFFFFLRGNTASSFLFLCPLGERWSRTKPLQDMTCSKTRLFCGSQ